MKIKIVRSDKDKWYSDRIGKVYVVKEIREVLGIMRVIIRNYRTIWRFVDYDDVEIVNELHEAVENLKSEIFKRLALPQIAKFLNTLVKEWDIKTSNKKLK